MTSSLHRKGDGLYRQKPCSTTLWGDGFDGDTLHDLWAVRDWSLCSSDEYILLFPRLVSRAGEFPPALRVHLESCISARAWRLARLEARGTPVPVRSHLPDRDKDAARHRDWFADDDAVTCLLRRIGFLRTAPGRVDAERQLLIFLDGLLFEIQRHRKPAWNACSEALLAFGAGIHPGYLWPEATVSPIRGAVAGWLGHLDRARTALMPLSVAEYVIDALHGGMSSDRQLVELSGGIGSVALLRRAAFRRFAGGDPSIRLAPDSASLARVFSCWPRAALPSEAGA